MELLNDSPQDEEMNENENTEEVPVAEPVEEPAEETEMNVSEDEETVVEEEDLEDDDQTFAQVETETKSRKKGIIIGSAIAGALVVIAIVVGLLFPDLFSAKGPVLATVGKEKIYVEDFQERVRYYRWQFLNQYAQISQIVQYFGDYDGNQQNQLDQITMLLGNRDLFGEIVLNSMIDEVILTSKAEELDIVVTDEDVQEVIEEAFGYDPDAATAEESDDNALYADPETQPTPYTEELFNENYADYVSDLALAKVSEAEFREVQWVSMIHNKLFEEITKDYVAGTEEEVWARHILVEDEETALSVIEQINSGEKTFEELAAEVSLDTGSGQYGGDLGWFGRGMMIPEFEDAAFSLEINEISAPIETQYGFHIIQVLGHEDQTISEEQQLTEKQALFTNWLELQRTELGSEIDEELLAESVPTDPDLSDPLIYDALFNTPEEGTEE